MTTLQGIRRGAGPAGVVLFLLIAVTCGSSRDDERQVVPVVEFEKSTLYIGSYQPVDVTIDPASELAFEDLEFWVDPAVGSVSMSQDARFDPASPTIMLIAGAEPGLHAVYAFEKGSGRRVGEGEFTVTDVWTEQEFGPSIVYDGREVNTTPPSGRSKHDEPEEHEVLIVYVDTASRRFPQPHEFERWEDVFFKPFQPSVYQYYKEVSRNQFYVLGKASRYIVSLPEPFEHHFYARDPNDDPDRTDKWFPKENTLQDIAARAKGYIDFSNVDSVSVVVMDPDSDLEWSGRYAYPHVNRTVHFALPEENRVIPTIFFPFGWDVFVQKYGTYTAVDLAAHEFGHVLGLPDLYRGVPEGRRQMGYDVMGGQIRHLPHLSVYHKWLLGWVGDDQLRMVDINESGGINVNLLRNSWTAHDPRNRPGGYAAVGYHLAPGLSYWFEHRHKPMDDASAVAEQKITPEPVVLGMEVRPGTEPHLYFLDPNKGDGFRLTQVGMTYEEEDLGDPDNLRKVSVRLDDIDDLRAELTLKYEAIDRPDPNLNRWETSGPNAWRSQDVLIRNARNWDGTQWTNEEWKWDALLDAENRIVARVSNSGTRDAPGVRVMFRYTNWGAGQPEENWKVLSIHEGINVPAGRTVEVVSEPWFPADGGAASEGDHFCVDAIILGEGDTIDAPYVVPGSDPRILETYAGNNRAQSNVKLLFSATSSPSSRVGGPFRLFNPTDRDESFVVGFEQTNPLYRTYLQHTWVKIPAGGWKDIEVYSEYVGEEKDPVLLDRFRDLPNQVILTGLMFDGEDGPRWPIGGATMEVRRGDRTEFVETLALPAGEGQVMLRGQVRNVRTGQPVSDGFVVVTLGTSPPQSLRVDLQLGTFETTVTAEGWQTARAIYVPSPGLADARSSTLENPGP